MITTFSIFEVQIWYCNTFEFALGCYFRKMKQIPGKM